MSQTHLSLQTPPFTSFHKIIVTFSEYTLGEIDLEPENLGELSSPKLGGKTKTKTDFVTNICVFHASYLNIIFQNLYVGLALLLNE